MGTVISIAAQLVSLGIPLAIQIIDAVNAEMALSGSATGPSPEDQAKIDEGSRLAHAALQAAQQAS